MLLAALLFTGLRAEAQEEANTQPIVDEPTAGLDPEERQRFLNLLAEIVSSQRWGIPPETPGGWKLHFKGGWSGRPNWRVNQVMLLRRPPRRLSVAILTRDQPSKNYGEQSIRGVAKRLLRGYNAATR